MRGFLTVQRFHEDPRLCPVEALISYSNKVSTSSVYTANNNNITLDKAVYREQKVILCVLLSAVFSCHLQNPFKVDSYCFGRCRIRHEPLESSLQSCRSILFPKEAAVLSRALKACGLVLSWHSLQEILRKILLSAFRFYDHVLDKINLLLD